jgi:hypothetical protein
LPLNIRARFQQTLTITFVGLRYDHESIAFAKLLPRRVRIGIVIAQQHLQRLSDCALESTDQGSGSNGYRQSWLDDRPR